MTTQLKPIRKTSKDYWSNLYTNPIIKRKPVVTIESEELLDFISHRLLDKTQQVYQSLTLEFNKKKSAEIKKIKLESLQMPILPEIYNDQIKEYKYKGKIASNLKEENGANTERTEGSHKKGELDSAIHQNKWSNSKDKTKLRELCSFLAIESSQIKKKRDLQIGNKRKETPVITENKTDTNTWLPQVHCIKFTPQCLQNHRSSSLSKKASELIVLIKKKKLKPGKEMSERMDAIRSSNKYFQELKGEINRKLRSKSVCKLGIVSKLEAKKAMERAEFRQEKAARKAELDALLKKAREIKLGESLV